MSKKSKGRKIVFLKKGGFVIAEDDKSRVTIQLRMYGKDGKYIPEKSSRGNETIWIKNTSIEQAFEIVKSALMGSRNLSESFWVE